MAQSNSVLQIYGGDEVAAIVLDPGSQTTRIGYAGEDTPREIVPSYVGILPDDGEVMDMDMDMNMNMNMNTSKKVKKRNNTYFKESLINYPRSYADLKPIVKDGIIQDWDSAVEQWEYLFENLFVDYNEQPLLFTEPVWNTESNRKKSLEVALEQFGFPGFYLASNPTCVAFAQGRQSALVVDVGHDVASVTPVIDGMCLTKTTLKTHYAGAFISAQLKKKLASINEEIIPKYKVKSKVLTKLEEKPNWVPKQFKNITQSYEDYQYEKALHEIKEILLKTSHDPLMDLKVDDIDLDETFPKRSFEQSNGHTFEFGKERFEIVETIFNPELYPIDSFKAESGEPEIENKNDYVPLKRTKKTEEGDDDASTGINNSNKRAKKEIVKYRGLSQLVSHALALSDVDIRAQLAHNIIVTGSSSLIPGLTERLYQEVTKAHPGLKVRLHASGNLTERKFQSWLGGSILSSLGTFHQLWVSRKEFEEVGVERLLSQRFR